MSEREWWTRTTNRRFLLALGAVSGAVVLGACSDDDSDTVEEIDEIEGLVPTATTLPPDPAPAAADLDTILAMAQHEQRSLTTYGAVKAVLAEGSLGNAPPPFEPLVDTAIRHHQAHLDAWGAVLARASRPLGAADAAESAEITAAVRSAAGVAAVEALLIKAEKAAADNYLAGIGATDDRGTLFLAATIRPIELQLAAVLRFLHGDFPVPDHLE